MTRTIGGTDARPWGLIFDLDQSADDLVELFPYAQHVQRLSEF
jgi:hypothetical protein